MSKKSDLFLNLVSRSIMQLVKKESTVSAKEIIEDIEDADDKVDIDKDKLPATATAQLYKGHLKKFMKKSKKYKGGLKKFQDVKEQNKKSKEIIKELSKAVPLFSGSGAQKAKGFGSILTGNSPPPPPPPPPPVKKDEIEDKKYKGGLKKFQMDKAEKFGSLSVNHFPVGHIHRGNKIVSVTHDHDNKMIHVTTDRKKMGDLEIIHSYDVKSPPKRAFDTKKP